MRRACGVHKQLMTCKDLTAFTDHGPSASYCHCMLKSGRPSKELNIMKFGDSIEKKPNNSKILQFRKIIKYSYKSFIVTFSKYETPWPNNFI